MLRFDPANKTVVMSLVDLEHCGFRHEDFDFELSTCGIDDREARWPVALVIDFAGGHVVTPDTSDETLERQAQAARLFEQILQRLAGRPA